MALIVIAPPVGLRHQRVQPQQQPDPEQRRRVEDRISQRDCADRHRPQPAHHDVVHNALRHPAQLAQHNGHGKRNHRRKLRSPPGACLDHLSNLSGARQCRCESMTRELGSRILFFAGRNGPCVRRYAECTCGSERHNCRPPRRKRKPTSQNRDVGTRRVAQVPRWCNYHHHLGCPMSGLSDMGFNRPQPDVYGDSYSVGRRKPRRAAVHSDSISTTPSFPVA